MSLNPSSDPTVVYVNSINQPASPNYNDLLKSYENAVLESGVPNFIGNFPVASNSSFTYSYVPDSFPASKYRVFVIDKETGNEIFSGDMKSYGMSETYLQSQGPGTSRRLNMQVDGDLITKPASIAMYKKEEKQEPEQIHSVVKPDTLEARDW